MSNIPDTATTATTDTTTDDIEPTSWREWLPVHPACELFPPMGREELIALGEDIKANGLRSPIILWEETQHRGDKFLLDGRNRLDAMELVGLDVSEVTVESRMLCGKYLDRKKKQLVPSNIDPYAYVISANIHRRHLTPEKKRDLIADLLKADPSKSNRTIAEMVKSNHHTVGRVRAEAEATGTISQLSETTGKDGKVRPVQRAAQPKPAPTSPQRRSRHLERFDSAMGVFLAAGHMSEAIDDMDLRDVTADLARQTLAEIDEAQAALTRLRARIEQHLTALADDGFPALPAGLARPQHH